MSGNIGIMALSWFLFSLSSGLVTPFFSIYAKELGATDQDVANIRALASLALALTLPVGGVLTDKIGRVKTILIGTVGVGIAQFIYATATDWRVFAAAWVLDSALHFYQPALTAIVMDSLPKDKTFRGFLILNIIPSTPSLFMPVAGGLLYDKFGVMGVRAGFIFMGIVTFIVFFLRLKGFKETFAAKDKELSNLILELAGYRPILSKAFKIYLFTALLNQVAFSVLNTYGAIYATQVVGLSKTEWGVITSFATLGGILGSILLYAKNLSDSRKITVLSYVISVSSMLALVLPLYFKVTPLVLFAIMFTTMNISGNIVGSAISSVLTRVLPKEIRGRAVSIQRVLENIGAALSSWIAGVLYTGLKPSEALEICSLVGFSSAIYLYLVLRE